MEENIHVQTQPKSKSTDSQELQEIRSESQKSTCLYYSKINIAVLLFHEVYISVINYILFEIPKDGKMTKALNLFSLARCGGSHL